MTQTLDPEQMYLIFKAKVEAFDTQKAAADYFKISTSLVNDLLQRRRSISSSIAAKVGYEKRTIFEKL